MSKHKLFAKGAKSPIGSPRHSAPAAPAVVAGLPPPEFFVVSEAALQKRAWGILTDEHILRRAPDGHEVPHPVRPAARVFGRGGECLRLHPCQERGGSVLKIPGAPRPERRAEQTGRQRVPSDSRQCGEANDTAGYGGAERNDGTKHRATLHNQRGQSVQSRGGSMRGTNTFH